LITSKTRLKLLLKFFLNPDTKSYLRSLADEFGESSNAVRVELNRLLDANLLKTETEGRLKFYQANTTHPMFQDIQNIVKKYIGIDQLIENIIHKLGTIDLALITGDYAKGIDSGIIDLVIIGEVDQSFLQLLVGKSEKLIERRIRTLVLTKDEFEKYKSKLIQESILIVWNYDKQNQIS
jgi:hypothetical protein